MVDLHQACMNPKALRNGVALGVCAWAVLITGVACAVRLMGN